MYGGFKFHKVKSYYKSKSDKNNIYWRCKNYLKDERNRIGIGHFCNAKIELIIDISNNLNNQKFKLITDHSKDSC